MKEISEDLKNFIKEHGIFILATEGQRILEEFTGIPFNNSISKTYNELKDLNFDPIKIYSIKIPIIQKVISIQTLTTYHVQCYIEISKWLNQILENRFESTSEVKTNFDGIYGLFPTSDNGDFACDMIISKECIWHN